LINIAGYSASILASTMGVMMIVAWCAGRFIGQRFCSNTGSPAPSDRELVSAKLSPYLALLSLLLGFTFSMSLSRHERRLAMVVADSNAIGDFYTCASLLKEPVRTQLRAVVRQYAELHLKMARQRLDRAAWENALRSNALLQDEMTKLVSKALNDGTPIAVPLTNTLDGVSSALTARLAAVEDRVPGSVLLLLFALAIVALALDGIELGGSGTSSAVEVVGRLSFIFLIALAVFVTLDLDQPDRGLITVSQAPIDRLVSSMSE
jgi:hypothetical protein